MEKKYSLKKSDSIAEILAVRDELEKTLDLMKKKEREYELTNDEHQNDLKMKQKQINKLNNELNEMKIVNNGLRDQLDMKNVEIKRIKIEAQEELK